jgi:HTH-type transcriptional regulator/antitoxin HigA
MEQQNLIQRNLVPYIGSRSKVSEVLSRKRPLSLSMVRSLHFGLGIPAKILLQEQDSKKFEYSEIDFDRFPVDEMVSRGWIRSTRNLESAIKEFISPLGLSGVQAILYRRTIHVRSERPVDEYALVAWTSRIVNRSLKNKPEINFDPTRLNLDFLHQLAKLSVYDDGPIQAQNNLLKLGVSLIIEPYLSRTHLDGVAILTETFPIIGLSLRYDRIDNFWFSLFHELAHIALHRDSAIEKFFDDLDLQSQDDPLEEEADKFASEALIPEPIWIKSPASRLQTPEAALHLAKKLEIHPAIVAGKMRHKFNNFRILTNLVGHNQVRKHFPAIGWE